MPVSHIGLTVSHLPTSCSFFLSALQPLGYRFIGQQGNQIGLGIHDADFFLCQETPGVKAGAAHIAFTAPDRAAVRDFYAAALNAGGRPNGAPASRTEEMGHFNAAVMDLDGNSIEVVYKDTPDLRDDGTVIQHSRVIMWQRSVAESCRDDRSVVSSRTAASASNKGPASEVSVPASRAPSVASATSAASKTASIARSVSEPVAVPQAPQTTTTVTTTTKVTATGNGSANKIIGTILGAAAGAAVAYAMVKGEEDSAKKEAEFEAYYHAKITAHEVQTQAPAAITAAQAPSQPKLSMRDPQPIYASPPRSIHRNISDTDSHYSTASHRDRNASVYLPQVRAIEAPPSKGSSYHAPSYSSVPPTVVAERKAIEYVPASSIAPSRGHISLHRSATTPVLAIEKARSNVSVPRSSATKAHSIAPSAVHSMAPSTLISSFVPDQVPRRDSEGSIASSHHSSRSKAKSHHTSASHHSSKSKAKSHTREPSPSGLSKIGSKAGSIVGSILGRDAASTASKPALQRTNTTDTWEISELDLDYNDADTVAPSDSISNAGSSSRRSHRSHRSSSRSHAASEISSHSKSSKHSRHSEHSSSSRKSHRSSSHKDKDKSADDHSSHSHSPSFHSAHSHSHSHSPNTKAPATILSEPSDTSTIKPASRHRTSRKDSGVAVSNQDYDEMFNGNNVQYGKGTVVSLPVRGAGKGEAGGLLGVGAKEPERNRSVISYAMGQRLRPFEEK